MRISRIIATAVLATTAMTLYSYAVSASKNKNFKEPELLGEAAAKNLEIKSKDAQVMGWLTHYITGLAFVSVYDKIWKQPSQSPSQKSGLVLGAVSGLAGILVWKAVFNFLPKTPSTQKTGFYGQLLPAHIIFGATAATVYNEMEEKSV